MSDTPDPRTPTQILTDAISAVSTAVDVPAGADLLRLLMDARTWEQRVALSHQRSQSDDLVVAYAAALTKELEPHG